jgi:hypothetical protein
MLDLVFDGKAYAVPKKSVFELLNHHRALLDAKSYSVRCSVPSEVFESFVYSLKNQRHPAVTKENAVSLLLLADEFYLPELASECATCPVSAEQFSKLAERACKLERQVPYLSTPRRRFEEDMKSQERGLETLRLEIERLKSGRPRPLWKTEIPIKAAKSFDGSCSLNWAQREAIVKENHDASLEGIISYLTKKHGGGIYEKGIVIISSKSVDDDPKYALRNIVDLTSHQPFLSKDQSGQWVCWDFGEMRVRPTHYTINALFTLKLWAVEGSLDGRSWTEVDRKKNHQDFDFHMIKSFAVSKPAEFRFIRLTQTDKNSQRNDLLVVEAVEFFGIVSE